MKYLGISISKGASRWLSGAMQEIQEMWVWSLGQEDPLEKEIAPHSSVLALRIPRTEEPGGYDSWRHKELDTANAT